MGTETWTELFWERYFLPCAICAGAFFLSRSLCFLARKIAGRMGAVDVPREARRMHTRPTPRDGGIAVFLTFLACTLPLAWISPTRTLAAAWVGGGILFVTGLWDDISPLNVVPRLFLQILAALIAVFGTFNGSGAGEVLLRMFGVVFLVALTNAHNFIDGIDGLCAKITAAEALGLVLVLRTAEGSSAVFSPHAYALLILGFALLGFLPLGHSPASLFLGDCGSTTAGYLVGVFALSHVGKIGKTVAGAGEELSMTGAAVSLFLLLLLFSVPLADLFLAILRRGTGATNPFLPDRRHLHHLLVDAGNSHSTAGNLLTVLSSVFLLTAIAISAVGTGIPDQTAADTVLSADAVSAAQSAAAKDFTDSDGLTVPSASPPEGAGDTGVLFPFASLGCVAGALLLLWVYRWMSLSRAAKQKQRIAETAAAKKNRRLLPHPSSEELLTENDSSL